MASRFERLFSSWVISLSCSPVSTGAGAALLFLSVLLGTACCEAAIGVAPENLHVQWSMQVSQLVNVFKRLRELRRQSDVNS